jgi:hypothetical protein
MTARIVTTVEMVDGTVHEIRVLPLDIVRMERHYGVGLAKLANNGDMLTEHVMFMAWSALTRLGIWSGDLESFIEQVAEIPDPPAGPDPSTPTAPAL